ncbi:MAG: phage holin family protein [Enterobacterales bacterium]
MPNETGPILKHLIDLGLGYVWFVLLAIWGGTVNYLTRRKKDKLPFSVVELIGEWAISGFAGIITVLICQEMGLSATITAATAGIAGHMGGRSIFMLEQHFQNRIGIKGNSGDK